MSDESLPVQLPLFPEDGVSVESVPVSAGADEPAQAPAAALDNQGQLQAVPDTAPMIVGISLGVPPMSDSEDRPWIFKPSNPWRWRKGQSGNPGGVPKKLSDAYRKSLEEVDENGMPNSAKIAMAQVWKATVLADTQAAREIRTATEGDTVNLSKLGNDELDAHITELEGRIKSLSGPGPVIENQPRQISPPPAPEEAKPA